MAKDNNMLTKKELIQFLERVEQLAEEDDVTKEMLGRLLRKIFASVTDQNDTLPINSAVISESKALSNVRTQHAETRHERLQSDNAHLQEKIAQLMQSNQQLEEERMAWLNKSKHQEQDMKRLQQKITDLTQQQQMLKQNNESLNQEKQNLNQKLNSFGWANSIKSEFDFLKLVQSHAEISSILLPNGDDNVLQLIAIAAQWNNVLRVWDALATQVKNTQQALSATELQILEHSLALFNLTLQSNQASLTKPEIGESYDYDLHQKISGSGGNIEQVLLAGLDNAAGENVRAAIVTTR